MEDIVKNWKEKSQKNYDLNLSFLTRIRGKAEWDDTADTVHKEVFEKADCLKCANCCKTTPAIVERSDVKRIARFLGIPPKSFIRKYLLEDIDGGMVIQRVPCTFLNSDNTCAIYEVRPKACREYPHTNRKRMHQILDITVKNTRVCPAVASIAQKMMGKTI